MNISDKEERIPNYSAGITSNSKYPLSLQEVQEI
ncbi:unnamed protein product [Paramecium octaurelia]|uniref:Uncharacterized protein n=1 Tax=Paramecium octaurelia TaxID=43137 RepID=A0A8S1VDS6_PAROT|nr:unnamed protein product [Paramecium octaurelia]